MGAGVGSHIVLERAINMGSALQPLHCPKVAEPQGHPSMRVYVAQRSQHVFDEDHDDGGCLDCKLKGKEQVHRHALDQRAGQRVLQKKGVDALQAGSGRGGQGLGQETLGRSPG